MSKEQEPNNRVDNLYRIRHSSAHVMAQAILELFPQAKLAIGPPIEEGFYYDFDLPRPLTPEDLVVIERRMKEIIQGGHSFQCREVTLAEAREMFRDQPYKLELIQNILNAVLNEDGQPLSEVQDAKLTTFRHDSFEDLCRGPHVANTCEINPEAIKILSTAGAYWRVMSTGRCCNGFTAQLGRLMRISRIISDESKKQSSAITEDSGRGLIFLAPVRRSDPV